MVVAGKSEVDPVRVEAPNALFLSRLVPSSSPVIKFIVWAGRPPATT
jgi:hypothetical protein